MSNFGSDLIFEEILPRLPAKSLIRFKCVSKYFKAQISSREFVRLYLRHHSVSSSSDQLCILSGIHPTSLICYDLDSPIATKTCSWPDDTYSGKIVGSCNGLLCISTITQGLSNSELFLLNPTTQICIDVTLPDRARYNSIGFAFDPDNLDFKIVEIVDTNCSHKANTWSTNIYSLNTNSWTEIEIETNLPPQDDSVARVRHGNGVLINNHLLHWIVNDPSLYKSHSIGCFDVCNNKWSYDVLLPHCYYEPINLLLGIGVVDGLLFSYIFSDGNGIWVMKEYGIQDSWIKLLSFKNDLIYSGMPVAFHGDEILLTDRVALFLWYNRTDGKIRYGKFDGAAEALCMCSRSLIELPGEPF